MKENTKRKAYAGKVTEILGHKYFLLEERVRGGCKGCDLISSMGCTKEVTELCRQGFIYKRLKK